MIKIGQIISRNDFGIKDLLTDEEWDEFVNSPIPEVKAGDKVLSFMQANTSVEGKYVYCFVLSRVIETSRIRDSLMFSQDTVKHQGFEFYNYGAFCQWYEDPYPYIGMGSAPLQILPDRIKNVLKPTGAVSRWRDILTSRSDYVERMVLS